MNSTMKAVAARSHIVAVLGLLALAVASALAPGASFAGPLQADVLAIHRSLIRVVANGSTSSGFLYGGDNRTIITTLHSVLPPGGAIDVFCRGNPARATVTRYLQEADLVVLEASEALDALGCRAIADLRLAVIPPGEVGADLYAFGFKPGNSRSAFSKQLKKASGDPETLEALLPDKVVSRIRGPFIPDLRQPLYYVNGGIYPGYSGGPVFNDQGALVGVVQGGLDKGTSNHDWLLPSSAISTLLQAPEGRELPNIDPASFGYSAPPAEVATVALAGNTTVPPQSGDVRHQTDDEGHVSQNPGDPELDEILDALDQLGDEPLSGLEYSALLGPSSIDDCFAEDYAYTWVKTRTRDFAELYHTTDPAEGLDQLLGVLQKLGLNIEATERRNPRFDVYEELCLGAVIAVPVGTELQYEAHEEGDFLVAVNAPALTGDQAVFRVGHEQFKFTLDDGTEVSPGHEDFFPEALEYYLDQCDVSYDNCEIDSDLFRVVVYEDGSGTMRAATMGDVTDDAFILNFHSVVVSSGEVLEADTRIYLDNDSELMRCLADPTAAACGESSWQQIAFLLANYFTNFTGKPVDQTPEVLTARDIGM